MSKATPNFRHLVHVRKTTFVVARSNRGNMLVLVSAVLAAIIVGLIIFCLKYTRILGGAQEQKTAIEAAALAAARALNTIVIEDPYYGFISLSDAAPCGKGTAAKDGFDMPVQGINTLLATVRLDLIIADKLENPMMQQCALRDYRLAMIAKDSLNKALASAVVSGGFGTDINGDQVSPTQAAIAAYESNVQRMTGAKNRLVPNSLKLSLGFIPDLPTNTSIPQPTGVGKLKPNQVSNNNYLSNVDASYTTTAGQKQDFVFAGLGDVVRLVDRKSFQSDIKGLPYSIPSVVLCEADQQFDDTDQNGRPLKRTIHAAACAEPSASQDPRPHPGWLTFNFPSGMVASIQNPADVFNSSGIASSPCDLFQTAVNGDAPPSSALVNTVLPLPPSPANSAISQASQFPFVTVPGHPFVVHVASLALYDWVRLAGLNLNVQALIDMLKTPFKDIGAGAGQIHMYQVTPDGTISYQVRTTNPTQVSWRVSQNQWIATSGSAVQEGLLSYDLVIKDHCYQPGRIEGGLHGGQPLGQQFGPGATQSTTTIADLFTGQKAYAAQITPPVDIGPFPPPVGSGPRPTYSSMDGHACDFQFRLHGLSP